MANKESENTTETSGEAKWLNPSRWEVRQAPPHHQVQAVEPEAEWLKVPQEGDQTRTSECGEHTGMPETIRTTRTIGPASISDELSDSSEVIGKEL